MRLHTRGDEADESTWFPFVLSGADVLFHLALALFHTGHAALNLEAILHLERILRLDPVFYELGLDAESVLTRNYHSTSKDLLPEACQGVCELLEDIHLEHVLGEGAGIKTEPEYWYNYSYLCSRSVTFGHELIAYRGAEIVSAKVAKHAMKLQQELINQLGAGAPELPAALQTLETMQYHFQYVDETIGKHYHFD